MAGAAMRSVVCISQTNGSGGLDVAHLVAERLGYRYVDEEIVQRAAEREKIDPEELADLERRQTFVRRFIRSIEQRAKLETFAHQVRYPDEVPAELERLPLATSDELMDAIRSAIREVAEQGQVVIVSHAASIGLADMPGLLRVLVTASPEIRAARLDPEATASARSLRTVRETDRARADYLRRFYGVRQEAPTHYDLVVNTDALPFSEVAELIVAAARGAPAPAR